MFGNLATPAFVGPVLGLVGLIASSAGKPALGAVLADPAIVSDVVEVVTAAETVVEKGIDLFGRVKVAFA